MAMQWLADIVEYLEDHNVADGRFVANLNKSLRHLKELQNSVEKSRLDGGLLEVALDRLENEFRRLYTLKSVARLFEQVFRRLIWTTYLEISVSEFNSVLSINGCIAQWGRHFEFAVKHLFEEFLCLFRRVNFWDLPSLGSRLQWSFQDARECNGLEEASDQHLACVVES